MQLQKTQKMCNLGCEAFWINRNVGRWDRNQISVSRRCTELKTGLKLSFGENILLDPGFSGSVHYIYNCMMKH